MSEPTNVAVVMGSESDLEVMTEATGILEYFGGPHECQGAGKVGQ